jgi:hypothetical protein
VSLEERALSRSPREFATDCQRVLAAFALFP